MPVFFFFLSCLFCDEKSSYDTLHRSLLVTYKGEHAQIEVGGPFVGIEMHHSAPAINRISFFYPVANSIDLSTDYWKRDQFRVMFLGLRVENRPKEWIGQKPFEYRLTPYSVLFIQDDDEKSIEIRYQFCKNKPAMIAQINITNISSKPLSFEVYTHLETSLRTCHTYRLKDKAWTEFDEYGSTVYMNFEDSETGHAQIFVANGGERPSSFTTNGKTVHLPGTGENWWMNSDQGLPGEIMDRDAPDRPVAAYIYTRNLAPKQKMNIVQIIGSCRMGEGKEIVDYLLNYYQEEIDLYEHSVLEKVFSENLWETSDRTIDHTVLWAKAMLITNAHYLDGDIIPMPCPAEYNFFFTHDVLLTDLAAVHFDGERVKKDLEFIIKHASADGTIPHAYYWKDHIYITEFAGADNWNHLWFILLSASYLRHSHDTQTLERIYPYISKSMMLTMLNKQDDDLMWALRPDWWDIGKSYGPRSYMTILAIRALRDFVYISTVLDKKDHELLSYTEMASRMQQQLNERLWDEDMGYLINYYEDGKKDSHMYIGSLLAAHYELIDDNKKRALVRTATQHLLDEKLGIYNVFPMDFHLLGETLKFSGNEAGDPFFYANGGIWSHGNAWYVLALMSIGEREKALQFLKNTMTLEGIMHSPNGQPAMYEYRNSNYQDSFVYGKVDKPQFLWAAGWTLYGLYYLLGIRENEWNIRFDPYDLENHRSSQFDIFLNGKSVNVRITGSGDYIKRIRFDGRNYPSAVVPVDTSFHRNIHIELGSPVCPYVDYTNSILVSSYFNQNGKSLILNLKAFPGHQNRTTVISPWKPNSITIDGEGLREGWRLSMEDGLYRINFNFSHRVSCHRIVLFF